jgi:hypothetical protein
MEEKSKSIRILVSVDGSYGAKNAYNVISDFQSHYSTNSLTIHIFS